MKEYLKGEIEIEEEFKNEKVEYLTFDLSNMERQIYPIIWIKIKSDSVLELKIKLKEKSQCFMRNGLLCYIETSRFIAGI